MECTDERRANRLTHSSKSIKCTRPAFSVKLHNVSQATKMDGTNN